MTKNKNGRHRNKLEVSPWRKRNNGSLRREKRVIKIKLVGKGKRRVQETISKVEGWFRAKIKGKGEMKMKVKSERKNA